ncbi:hypothetical protein NLJ89_g5809 [Agrocybe chaxingu]|uniref:Uncharacterized protein n=1 Tax=Agrocybe chaxingu TaxID=84603 RepID=A0A9W8K0C9_9AGAR|nr:hypothetical protein NLJ89_g5809 [Agrocybe chaxingu]
MSARTRVRRGRVRCSESTDILPEPQVSTSSGRRVRPPRRADASPSPAHGIMGVSDESTGSSSSSEEEPLAALFVPPIPDLTSATEEPATVSTPSHEEVEFPEAQNPAMSGASHSSPVCAQDDNNSEESPATDALVEQEEQESAEDPEDPVSKYIAHPDLNRCPILPHDPAKQELAELRSILQITVEDNVDVNGEDKESWESVEAIPGALYLSVAMSGTDGPTTTELSCIFDRDIETVFEALQTAYFESSPAKALLKRAVRRGGFRIALSAQPVPMAEDFTNYAHRFEELGPLEHFWAPDADRPLESRRLVRSLPGRHLDHFLDVLERVWDLNDVPHDVYSVYIYDQGSNALVMDCSPSRPSHHQAGTSIGPLAGPTHLPSSPLRSEFLDAYYSQHRNTFEAHNTNPNVSLLHRHFILYEEMKVIITDLKITSPTAGVNITWNDNTFHVTTTDVANWMGGTIHLFNATRPLIKRGKQIYNAMVSPPYNGQIPQPHQSFFFALRALFSDNSLVRSGDVKAVLGQLSQGNADLQALASFTVSGFSGKIAELFPIYT